MLQCTRSAAQALTDFRQREGVPETFGLRLAGSTSGEGRPGVRMDFRENPIEGDEVIEQHGQRLFVARELAPQLADATLDAAPEVSGAGVVLRRAGGE